MCVYMYMGFPGSSAGKEPTCNAGGPGSIPGLGRSPGEGIGYPLQYSWAFLVAQLVKNPPAMRETWVQSLGWEDPLEEGIATHFSILAWRIHGKKSLAGYIVSVQFQFSQFCLTLCDPMNHSTPGLSVHHQLPESTQTHVH